MMAAAGLLAMMPASVAAKRPGTGSHTGAGSKAHAATPTPATPGKRQAADKPWCAPEVAELSDHVCYFDGTAEQDRAGTARGGKRTLVVYLHGSLAPTPGFQYLQQRAMALHAKRHNFTVLLPTSPNIDGYFVWPTGKAAQEAHEPAVLAGIRESREALERKLQTHFDETFVVGFSSGAYYGSSLALRGALDVDGFVILAGGSSWARPSSGSSGTKTRRAPVFVGVSAADKQTAAHSRALAGTLAGLGWPHRVEERNAGHMVDWTFMAHGLAWLRSL